jgi:hypothetical protein
MVAAQKHAVFNLIVASLALLGFVVLTPHFGVARAQGAFALLAFTGLGPLFYRRRGKRAVSDERDQMIFLRATQISFAVFWLLFVSGVLAAYTVLKDHEQSFSIDLLPLVLWLGWIVLLVCHAAAILTLYWWNGRGTAENAQ